MFALISCIKNRCKYDIADTLEWEAGVYVHTRAFLYQHPQIVRECLAQYKDGLKLRQLIHLKSCVEVHFSRMKSDCSRYQKSLYHRSNVLGEVIQKQHLIQSNNIFQDSSAVQLAEFSLYLVHDYTGLSWWMSIIATTATLRTLLTFPASVYATHNIARYEALHPEIKALSERLRLEARHASGLHRWTEKFTRQKYNSSLRKILKGLYIRDNCHPLKSTIIYLIQLPLWFSFSIALRNMSGANLFENSVLSTGIESLQTGGVLWFPDLTLADPTYILPLSLVIIHLINIQLTISSRTTVTEHGRRFNNLARILVLLMLPIAATMPSCMSLYWSVSSLCNLIQNGILNTPRIRRWFGIPRVPSENETPFKQLFYTVRKWFYI